MTLVSLDMGDRSIYNTSCGGIDYSTARDSTSGCVDIAPTQDTNYSITCSGASATDTVTVYGPPRMIADLTVVPLEVDQGESVLVSWEADPAEINSCKVLYTQSFGPRLSTLSEELKGVDVEHFPSNRNRRSGSLATVFLTCSGLGGTVRQSKEITVNALSLLDGMNFNVDPTDILRGESTQITWSSEGTNTCSVYSRMKASSYTPKVLISNNPNTRCVGTDVNENRNGCLNFSPFFDADVSLTCSDRFREVSNTPVLVTVQDLSPTLPANWSSSFGAACPAPGDIATLLWGNVPGATGYKIVVNGNTINVTGNSYNLTSNPGSYRWFMRATNQYGDSTPVNGPAFTCEDSLLSPTLPANWSNSFNASCPAPGNTSTLSWGAVSDAIGYKISVDGVTTNVTGTSYDLPSSPGNHNWFMRATNQYGDSTPVNGPAFTCEDSPIVNVTTNPSRISTGQETEITWISSNATSCTVTNINIANDTRCPGTAAYTGDTTNGCVLKSPTLNTRYTATCTKDGVSVSDDRVVTVIRPFTNLTSASASQQVLLGSETTLNIKVDDVDADNCYLTNSLNADSIRLDANTVNSSDGVSITTISVTDTVIYTLTCQSETELGREYVETITLTTDFADF